MMLAEPPQVPGFVMVCKTFPAESICTRAGLSILNPVALAFISRLVPVKPAGIVI